MMRINKIDRFMVMFFTIFLAFAVSSCDSDDDKTIDVPQELIGTWDFYGMQITFEPDGTGYMTGDFGDEEMSLRALTRSMSRSGGMTIKFTYTYNAAERTIEINVSGETERWQIVELDENVLVIIDSEGEKLSMLKRGSIVPPTPNPNTDYELCPLSTLIGDWGVGGHAMYGFTSTGYIKWFWEDGKHFDTSRYGYDEEEGILTRLDGGGLFDAEGAVNTSVRKVSDNMIMLWDNGKPKAPVLLSRITDTPYAVGDISLLYGKTWTVVGVLSYDEKPAFPFVYYFDAKGIWSYNLQGDVLGGTFKYDNDTKNLKLDFMGETIQNYTILNLTENNVVLQTDGSYEDEVDRIEMTVLP